MDAYEAMYKKRAELERELPVLQVARSAVKGLKPGQLLPLPAHGLLSGFDLAPLLWVEGAAVLIKLPAAARHGNRIYLGVRQFRNGKPLRGCPIFEPGTYISDYMGEYSDTWLIEVAVLRNIFRAGKTLAAYSIRATSSLERIFTTQTSGRIASRPSDWKRHFFVHSRDREGLPPAELDTDIPLAMWGSLKDTVPQQHLMDSARRSWFATVFYAYFESRPKGQRSGSTDMHGRVRCE